MFRCPPRFSMVKQVPNDETAERFLILSMARSSNTDRQTQQAPTATNNRGCSFSNLPAPAQPATSSDKSTPTTTTAMFTSTKTIQLACVAALVAVASVDGHGYMSVPKATFTGGGDPTQFCATMDGPKTLTAPAGQSFTTDPSSNAKAFTAALKSSSYKSVRDLVNAKASFISGASKECGISSSSGAKQPLPAQYVEWAHSSSEGFTPSHEGPCEVWCDNNLAFSNDNCPKNYPSAPAKLPYDKSKCSGASMLRFYWVALHSSTWQVYINCAPLSGGSSTGGGGATSPVVAPTTAPAKGNNKAPAPAKGNTKTPKPAKTTKAPKKRESRSLDFDELDDLN